MRGRATFVSLALWPWEIHGEHGWVQFIEDLLNAKIHQVVIKAFFLCLCVCVCTLALPYVSVGMHTKAHVWRSENVS